MADTLFPDTIVRTGEHLVTALSHVTMPYGSLERQLLIAGTDAGHVVIWDLSIQSIVQNLNLHSNTVLFIHPLQYCNSIVAYTREQKVVFLLWCSDKRQLHIKKEIQPVESPCPTFCPAASCRLSGTSAMSCLAIPCDKSVQLYSIEPSSADIVAMDGMKLSAEAMVTCMKAFVRDDSSGVFLLVGTEAGNVNLFNYNAETKQTDSLSSLNTHNEEPVLTLDFIVNSKFGVTAGASGRISVWKCDNSTLRSHLSIETPSKGYNSVRLRSDAKLIIACAWDGMVRLYGPKKGTCLAILDFHRESVTAVSFDTDNRFVTSSKDKALCLWSLYANK
ncbi:guanine nucleotide-binding protein subunit beta-like protein 1 [Watersipora subatra]|uniref:guanine nucleotide-binding protein subunit beta-like protein 1 n=1 Tax=Watersipora subatra TaxID=2589382 RepID=UPI00355BEFF3